MHVARPASAVHPRLFGRGPRRQLEPVRNSASRISNDLKLFATTFAAGFIFVSVLLA